MKTLVICNNINEDSWGSADIVRCVRATSPEITVQVRRAPHQDLPPNPHAFERIILSGSKTGATEEGNWIEELDRFVGNAIEAGIPVLGICYGHQTLVRILGDRSYLGVSKTPELGWTQIEQSEETPLLRGLPQKFWSFSSHFDEVTRVPQGMRPFAFSERCAYQGLELVGKPVYGIQFHPERDAQAAVEYFRRKKGTPDEKLLLGSKDTAKLHNEEVQKTIFRNFLLGSSS